MSPRRRASLACLMIALASSSAARAAVRQVPSEFSTIQAAIAASSDGDEVVVATGTYHEPINLLGRRIIVRSVAGAAYTTIDAAGLGTSAVTFNVGETDMTVLEGFTITGGAGTQFAECQSCRRGGGVLCDGASPTIRSCIIAANHIDEQNAGGDGGGMACLHGASPTLVDCVFSQNSAAYGRGGGLYVRGSSTGALLTGCTFDSNSAAQGGGAGSSLDVAVTMSGCTFKHNTVTTSGFGGAIYVSGTWTTATTTFCGNSQPDLASGSLADAGGNSFSVDCPVDSDSVGLLDTTEIDMAMGSGCPSPLDADSDNDGLSDGAEVSAGTNPCNTDTDGDGVGDATDPLPITPGVTPQFLEDFIRGLCDQIRALPLSQFNGPNNNANAGRRNSLCNRASDAANAVHVGDKVGATNYLFSLLEKIDGDTPPPDWLYDTPQRQSLETSIRFVLALLNF